MGTEGNVVTLAKAVKAQGGNCRTGCTVVAEDEDVTFARVVRTPDQNSRGSGGRW